MLVIQVAGNEYPSVFPRYEIEFLRQVLLLERLVNDATSKKCLQYELYIDGTTLVGKIDAFTNIAMQSLSKRVGHPSETHA